eukprot:SAG31_NODE_2309_length_5961_cov_3.697373_6_plen_285_part_00
MAVFCACIGTARPLLRDDEFQVVRNSQLICSIFAGCGNLWLAKGSHRRTRAELARCHAERVQPQGAVEMKVPAGSAIVWRTAVWHCVGPNTSTETRKILHVGYHHRWVRRNRYLLYTGMTVYMSFCYIYHNDGIYVILLLSTRFTDTTLIDSHPHETSTRNFPRTLFRSSPLSALTKTQLIASNRLVCEPGACSSDQRTTPSSRQSCWHDATQCGGSFLVRCRKGGRRSGQTLTGLLPRNFGNHQTMMSRCVQLHRNGWRPQQQSCNSSRARTVLHVNPTTTCI